ncbi:MAG: pyridoxamine 5'-phosphate oxidase family protein [Candidatus Thorarchaeota archaeon]|jgi:predicted pyridoxine 5'-phosphate oxidase superfamily flavin-nucleotide-binding protein
MMSFVTDEMRSFVKSVSRGMLGTIDEDGYPHVTVKNGRLRKDGVLELWGVFGDITVNNIKQNPNVCVTFADFEKAWGYRYKGKAEVNTGGDRFEKVKGDLESFGWSLKELITINVESITLVSQQGSEINKKIL